MNKNVNLVIFNMSKITYVALRRFIYPPLGGRGLGQSAIGYGLLDIGYWILDIGYWILAWLAALLLFLPLTSRL